MSSVLARKCLTERLVAELAADPRVIFDTRVPSLCVRVRETGRRTYVFDLTRAARRHRITLGATTSLSLEEARTTARAMAARVEVGDPPVAPSGGTFEDVTQAWINEYARPRLRSWKAMRFQLGEQYCGALYSIPIEMLTRRHIRAVVAPLVANSPAMANAVQRTISAMLAWAVQQEIISANPCARMAMPALLVQRDRVLSDSEMRAFWRATGRMAFPDGAIFRVLALTGQRRKEVVGMQWSEVDLDDAMWTLPPARTKNAKTHDVPMTAETSRIIAAAPRAGPGVFTGTRGVMSVINRHLYEGKIFIDGAMPPGTPRWTPHDLRRTFSTWAAKQSFPQHVVEKILNHRPKHISGIAAIYNRYEYMTERRACLAAWETYLLSLDETVPLSLKVVR